MKTLTWLLILMSQTETVTYPMPDESTCWQFLEDLTSGDWGDPDKLPVVACKKAPQA